jgi:transcriptional regulator
MHPNPIFRQRPEADSLAFAQERGFGTLVVNGDPVPLLAHVPFLLDGRVVEFHLVRSNPVARAAPCDAVLAVTGPDGYISPDWYGLEDQVPTWNYVAVHLLGRVEVLEHESLRAHLDRLSERFETALAPKPVWRADKMSPGAMERLMRAIVPARLVVTEVRSTWKLGQNKTAAAREGAAAGRRGRHDGSERAALAALMEAVSP